MTKLSINKQKNCTLAIAIWVIVALMMILCYIPWFNISTSILIPVFLCVLIIISTIFYLIASKSINEPKILKTRSKIFAVISLIIFLIIAIILTIIILDISKVPEQNRELFIGYAILGLAPILAILLTGAISFLTIFLKFRKRAK